MSFPGTAPIERACRAAIALIPQWYFAECGPHEYTLSVDDCTLKFFSHRRMTPDLQGFFAILHGALRNDLGSHLLDAPTFPGVLQERYALYWLSQRARNVNWAKGVQYLSEMALRTFENNPVAINLIIGQDEGSADIASPKFQKVFDQLAASPFTYFKVDGEFRLKSYEEIKWSQVTESTSYKFHPEFLHPFNCALGPGEYALHLTSRGDIIAMSRGGLMASKRKGQWKLYDLATFKNSLTECVEDYSVGANLFEVLFDLSFRRHGALLIHDPDHRLTEHIVNPQSIIWPNHTPNSAQAALKSSVYDIAIGNGVGSLKHKRLLTELASIDGAVVFDDQYILAVGAMIRPHPEAQGEAGTRSTAALSAYRYGAKPIKVSSDGEITLLFQSRNGDKRCDARIEFL